ncbi:hypothetical protein [Mycobacterium sp. 1165178.9]|uniref:hypothetical protein n=1 Tax=Mycobacterium sp. 1165178.9 TaxID=1834070 RepID=UPI000A3E4582|nr:hypothetical protein [Mycobacterium sp. 1165178.9]
MSQTQEQGSGLTVTLAADSNLAAEIGARDSCSGIKCTCDTKPPRLTALARC